MGHPGETLGSWSESHGENGREGEACSRVYSFVGFEDNLLTGSSTAHAFKLEAICAATWSMTLRGHRSLRRAVERAWLMRSYPRPEHRDKLLDATRMLRPALQMPSPRADGEAINDHFDRFADDERCQPGDPDQTDRTP